MKKSSLAFIQSNESIGYLHLSYLKYYLENNFYLLASKPVHKSIKRNRAKKRAVKKSSIAYVRLNASHSVTVCTSKQLVNWHVDCYKYQNRSYITKHHSNGSDNITDVSNSIRFAARLVYCVTTTFRSCIRVVWCESMCISLTRSTHKPISYQLCLSISLNWFLP